MRRVSVGLVLLGGSLAVVACKRSGETTSSVTTSGAGGSSAQASSSGSGAFGSSSSGGGSGGGSTSASGSGGSSGGAPGTSSSIGASSSAASTGSSSSGSTSSGLRVVKGSGTTNGRIVDGAGTTVRLHGADRSGTEYGCVNGADMIFDGPSDQASITQMTAWKINAVRVPLNEDCWLGINGVDANVSGATYQAAIRSYVTLLEQNGMYVILDLHWAAPGTELANGQLGMADADHAPTFWGQVATAYAGDHDRVIFDLFNEPFITDWSCWLQGGACAKDANGDAYTAAGMATLLKAVRGAGADNVVMMGGLGYSSEFSSWVEEVNSIPTLSAPLDGLTTDNIAVSLHAYSFQNDLTGCPSQYDNYTGTCSSGAATAENYGIPGLLAAGYPVIVGEIGIDVDASNTSPYSTSQATGLATWLTDMLGYIDAQGQSYLAWDWSLDSGPLLITSYTTGAPTPYFGATYQSHLASAF